MAKTKTLSLQDIYEVTDSLILDDLLALQTFVNNKVDAEKIKAQETLEKISKTNA